MKTFIFENGTKKEIEENAKAEAQIFALICSYTIEMIDNDNFRCFGEPAKDSDYQNKKAALQEFAKEWQRAQSEIKSYYSDLAFWQSFFETYGKKYGLLNEFHENAIC